jgi:hypothetical protein
MNIFDKYNNSVKEINIGLSEIYGVIDLSRFTNLKSFTACLK